MTGKLTSERTIQRVEDGGSISAETLQALAGAFNVSIDALRVPAPAPTPGQPGEQFEIISLTPLQRASDLRGLIPADALQLGYDGMNDEQEDAIAQFEQALRDSNDIWSDLEPVQRRETLKDIQNAISELQRLEVAVAVGTDMLRLKAPDGKPFSLEVLHVILSKSDEPKLFAIRDKTAPVRFA